VGKIFFKNVALFEVLHAVGIARPMVCRKLKKITHGMSQMTSLQIKA
jgi:hypothetical protein